MAFSNMVVILLLALVAAAALMFSGAGQRGERIDPDYICGGARV
jgi:hypothetical protein